MCSQGVSNGLWCSLPPPFPFYFLITSPLPSLLGAQTRLSLRYFHLPLHPTLPGSSMTPQQQEMGLFSVHFFFSPLCVFLVTHPLPPSAHTLNRSQIISSTLSVARQLLYLLVTSSLPLCHHFHLRLKSAPPLLSPILHMLGDDSSCISTELTSLLLLLVCHSLPIRLTITLLPLVCSGTICTLRCYSVSYLLLQRGQEDGR